MNRMKDYFSILSTIGFDINEKICLVDGGKLLNRFALLHDVDEFALYAFLKDELQPHQMVSLISSDYPDDYRILVITPVKNIWKKEKVPFQELVNFTFIHQPVFIFFEPLLQHASLIEFKNQIAHLRSPQGCPWDLKQTHQSLRTNLLEESYEVLDAIDKNNPFELKEELGDLLLQIILQAQIASEKKEFTISEVIFEIINKITFRHPHVFQNLEINDVKGVIRNWEILKAKEKANKSTGSLQSILEGIPELLPSLSLAQKYQERAARVGFDWPDIAPVFEKIQEEIEELQSADDNLSKESELGDLLFAVVNLVRWYGYDAESVLRQMNRKFLRRFQFIESKVYSQNKKLTDLSLDEMDDLWEQSKCFEA